MMNDELEMDLIQWRWGSGTTYVPKFGAGGVGPLALSIFRTFPCNCHDVRSIFALSGSRPALAVAKGSI
jgi:hypothetical protein